MPACLAKASPNGRDSCPALAEFDYLKGQIMGELSGLREGQELSNARLDSHAGIMKGLQGDIVDFRREVLTRLAVVDDIAKSPEVRKARQSEYDELSKRHQKSQVKLICLAIISSAGALYEITNLVAKFLR